MCRNTQQTRNQTINSPSLRAAPGSSIVLWYQENGHVTLPDTQPGKPRNRGTVYIYGTSGPEPLEALLDVHRTWNTEGTGGDKLGKLLSISDFDDGQCYQINSGSISVSRQALFPHVAKPPMGADLWCHNNVSLPSDILLGEPYTLYWVWDWPTAPHVDPNLPKGKPEIYTTCIDLDII